MTLTKAEWMAKLLEETELDKPAGKSLVDQFVSKNCNPCKGEKGR